jgi:hypothetical protein
MPGLSRLQVGLAIGALVLLALAGFAIKAGLDKIARQGAQIEALERDLAAEKAARERDVRGLTVLAQGITAAATARGMDDEILRETIDARNPQPVSPDLARFLLGLRERDAGAAAPAERPGR